MSSKDRPSQPPPAVHVVARHWARPEAIDRVRELLTSLVAPSRREPGCLRYELLQHIDDPTDFTFVETFKSQAALDEHAAAAYIVDLQAELRMLIARPSEVRRYRAVAAADGRAQ